MMKIRLGISIFYCGLVKFVNMLSKGPIKTAEELLEAVEFGWTVI